MSLTTKFDNELCKLDCFNKRPFQLPHIGKFVEPGGVLFIMESHYVDPSFFVHQYDKENLNAEKPELFYNIEEGKFTEAFKAHFNTRQVIKDAESSDRKIAKGKSVFRKLSSAVKEGLRLEDSHDTSPLDYVTIYNYFQRPSYRLATTIKVCEEDKKVAYEALKHIVNTVNIRTIIFTSAKAYDCFKEKDDANKAEIQTNAKVFRGTHPRVWGNKCSYEPQITWRRWIVDRLSIRAHEVCSF